MSSILLMGTVLVISAVSSKILYRYGIPTLIGFLFLGMLSGSEVLGLIYFDDYESVRQLSDLALMFIMFSGGFGTSWKAARSGAILSGALATLGVVVTAAATGYGAHILLGIDLYAGLLLGSIISSTDAASIFSILRSMKLNLKCDLASTLEVESGSNDPMAFMLTVVMLAIITGGSQNIPLMLSKQILIGAAGGFLSGRLAVFLINRIRLEIDGLYYIISMGLVMMSFAIVNIAGGNGLLTVYIAGIIMGNSRTTYKISLVRFYDGVTWLMQIMLFFALGLLASPKGIGAIWAKGLIIALLVIFIARPLAVFLISWPFRKPFKEKLFLSWVGIRGAAAVVFAIYPLVEGIPSAVEIFDIVFFVILLSVLLQGSMLGPLAKRLSLTGDAETVLKTFTDYSGEFQAELLEVVISEGSDIDGKAIMDINMPEDALIITIKRGDRLITPKGSTLLLAGDKLLLSADSRKRLVEIDRLARNRGQIHKL